MVTHNKQNHWAEWQFRDSRIGRSPGYCSLPRDASALWVAFQLRPLCTQAMGGNLESPISRETIPQRVLYNMQQESEESLDGTNNLASPNRNVHRLRLRAKRTIASFARSDANTYNRSTIPEGASAFTIQKHLKKWGDLGNWFTYDILCQLRNSSIRYLNR
jgi:hypothetical protein